jgi:hypothetical protein
VAPCVLLLAAFGWISEQFYHRLCAHWTCCSFCAHRCYFQSLSRINFATPWRRDNLCEVANSRVGFLFRDQYFVHFFDWIQSMVRKQFMILTVLKYTRQHRKIMKELSLGVKSYGMSAENVLSLLVESGCIYSFLWVGNHPAFSCRPFDRPLSGNADHRLLGLWTRFPVELYFRSRCEDRPPDDGHVPDPHHRHRQFQAYNMGGIPGHYYSGPRFEFLEMGDHYRSIWSDGDRDLPRSWHSA